jgi:hypothetical protein
MVLEPASESYDLLADVPIEEVRVTPEGFVLEGHGTDRSGYRLEMHIDWPVDPQTKRVLSEILSQAEVRVMRWRSPPGRDRNL